MRESKKWQAAGHLIINSKDGTTILQMSDRREREEYTDLIVRACNSHKALVEACQWFIEQMDSGYIVRDISRDGDDDYHAKAMKFVLGLQKAQDAIKLAEEGQ